MDSDISFLYNYTIVIISYSRTRCLNRAFRKIYHEENLPKDTEIVIADDNTPSTTHKETLIELSKYPRVTVVCNHGYHGAFYNKLNGFLMARGKYVMSCDDDDSIDTGYFREMINHIDDKYDIIYTIIATFTNKKFGSIEEMITSFHNFCNIAFKKELILSIDYPRSISILRDDAPLIIPLYMKTDIHKIKAYSNKYHYRLDRYCDHLYQNVHQSQTYADQESVRNGYRFLINYAEKNNFNHFIPSIKIAYKGYLYKIGN